MSTSSDSEPSKTTVLRNLRIRFTARTVVVTNIPTPNHFSPDDFYMLGWPEVPDHTEAPGGGGCLASWAPDWSEFTYEYRSDVDRQQRLAIVKHVKDVIGYWYYDD